MSIILGWLADFWEFIAPWFSAPAGEGAMRVASFVRYTGAASLGHVGWAFDFGADNVNAGSVENPAGSPTQPAPTMGYWDDFLADPMPTMKTKGYSSLKYINLERGNPLTAYRVAQWIGTKAYDVFGRNCMDDAYDVLRAYGVPELPLPSHDILPNAWFDALDATFANVDGFTWPKPGRADFATRIALTLAKNAPSKVPTWRQPGHHDYKNLQAQLAAHEAQSGTRSAT